MKIIDWYILKRFLTTFLFTLLILIPIAVAIDVSEKIDNFLNSDLLTLSEVINDYYVNFIIYYSNTFMPLALFLAIIIFTSKLANNTEIIAINDAQVSFVRFMYPYLIGATLITSFALAMNHYIVPKSTKVRKKFENTHVNRGGNKQHEIVTNISLQLNENTYIYLESFDINDNSGYDFSIDEYNGLELKTKLTGNTISWSPKDSVFSILSWQRRIITSKNDILSSGSKLDTVFEFTPSDFVHKDALAQEMPTPELRKFLSLSEQRGVKNLNAYRVEIYKRTSLPIASYILTMIAVALSYRKRRGGMGVSLAIGVTVMFIYVFFLKVAEVLGAGAEANPIVSVWMPNMVFGCFSIYLFFKARQ